MKTAPDILPILRAALPELRAKWPIKSLALFGSRVRDDATEQSDLDVLAEFDKPISFAAFLALEERLATITGFQVDLVSTAALKRRIGARIRAEAVAV